MYLPPDKFYRLEKEWTATPEFKAMKAELVEKEGGRCFACGLAYLDVGGWLEANHTDYRASDGSLIFGHPEEKSKLVLMCGNRNRKRAHHRKGKMAMAQCRSWRSYYRTRQRMAWFLMLPWQIVRWLYGRIG